MAGFSMCFQLLADEIVAKFQWIGEKIGLKKKDEEEGESSGDDNDAEGGGSKDK